MTRPHEGEPESVRGSGYFDKSMETLGGPHPVIVEQQQQVPPNEPPPTSAAAWGDIDE
ncbi:hypothetical protein AB0L97_34580 [Nocardia sp. NPDC051911]|uniref:hypothetical protein n=1 Tax=Nocardia sp. NPDC051911 TaxID=3154648 RepID=UPI0034156853